MFLYGLIAVAIHWVTMAVMTGTRRPVEMVIMAVFVFWLELWMIRQVWEESLVGVDVGEIEGWVIVEDGSFPCA